MKFTTILATVAVGIKLEQTTPHSSFPSQELIRMFQDEEITETVAESAMTSAIEGAAANIPGVSPEVAGVIADNLGALAAGNGAEVLGATADEYLADLDLDCDDSSGDCVCNVAGGEGMIVNAMICNDAIYGIIDGAADQAIAFVQDRAGGWIDNASSRFGNN